MEESPNAACQLPAFYPSLNIASTTKSNVAFSHLPSLGRTCRSSSTVSSQCSTSEAGPSAPLNTVTTSISYCDDNEEKSDVSSVSSGDSLEELSPRSIFSSYWRTKGGAPGSLRRVLAAAAGSSDDDGGETDDSQSHSTNTYERTLCTQEDHHNIPRSSQATHPRRRIFEGLHRSAPELSLVSPAPSHQRHPGGSRDAPMRKTRSTSALMRRPSCMSRRTQRSTSDRSVSFSPQVNIVVFTPPTEQWASKGWSDYFV